MKKILVLCHDTVGSKMAGPGIRYQNLAEQMKKAGSVTLAVFSDNDDTSAKIPAVKTTGQQYKDIFDEHDVIFAQWLSGEMLNYAKSTNKIVVIDLYAPVPVEYLASLGYSSRELGVDQDLEFSGILETYKRYLSTADFFVCSNERQRDFWYGFLTSSNIITPTNFRSFSEAENIALCPMGISSQKPKGASLKLRKRIGLKKNDFVLLWTGGIWDWFDASIVINAINLLGEPKVKLVFMGTQHPNSKVVEMSESKKARLLAEKLGLINKSVFFLDGWVDYGDRENYLMDADVAIYADKESIETRFSHRTRVLDHIWAGIPTICSRGDFLSDQIESLRMGLIVPERTPEAFSAAIKRAFENPSTLEEIKRNIEVNRQLFTWDELSKDLLQFIAECRPHPSRLVSPSVNLPPSVSRRLKAKRRVKNSIKVLLGRIDV